MNDSKGLGRGLEALFKNTNNQVGQLPPGDTGSLDLYQELSIDQIKGNPKQPRTIFDDAALAELADSLKAVGLVQPVVVRRRGKEFEIVAGERRWRAARLAGLKKIPAIIREAGDAESLELALIENLSREDLNPIDTARAYASLQEDFGITQEVLAGKLGRSRSAVANTMRLLDLPDEVQTLIENGKLSEGHGRALLSIPDRLRQRQLAAKAAAKSMTVRQLEEQAKKESSRRRRNDSRPAPVSQELMDEATDALYSAFRLPVKVRWASKGGRAELEFASSADLRRIIGVLEKDL
ncbi:MAG: ParB/RepB/Spo0J family partition protein [Actinobacteria bacterium]|nr:ParB/RepB/Spo0J family partition protein [Actinomycetota bacterium]